MQRTDPTSQADRLAARFDGSDRWLLGLAAFAVAIYLVDLRGGWAALGVQRVHDVVALAIDSVFVVDFLLKCWFLRGHYLRSPWALIDFLSALPILASLAAVPQFFEGLRVARGVRLFRMLRMLRTLRVLRSIRLFQFVKLPPDATPERRAFERTLRVSVLLYTGLFLALMTQVHLSRPENELVAVTPAAYANEIEFWFVVGSILGMLLIVVVARAQVPAVAAHQVRTLLNVALPVQVAEHLMRAPQDYDHTVRMPASIIFCDISGFTSAVEALGDDLDALKTHLEAALDAVVRVHARYDLIVDKFIGDAVMSFRGGDLVSGTPADHAWRVVRAAIEAPRALAALADPHFRQVRVGGASAEDALIGTFGTSSRLSYTVLGDRVNLAARLESASKPLGTSNLFCEKTRRLTAGRTDIIWRKIGVLRAEGKREAVDVHEAFDAADDLAWLPDWEAALAAYEARDFNAARAGFAAVDAARPGGDGPARFYLPLCEKALSEGLPREWSQVLELKK